MSFLKLRTDAALKKNKTVRSSMPYKQAVNMGIIFTVEDKQKHDDIKDFIHRLEQEGKKVTVLEFLPEKKDNYEFKFDFFTIKELSFWGNINSDAANAFAEKVFDYLYYIDRESNPLILNLLARSKAHFRIGRFNDNEQQYFELMIEQNSSNRDLINSMYNYTSKLR
ncbi:MAG: hypothetical protein MUF39_04740 [Cyclobacteriaceae bacterium]|jgi:hypothetical protein|nr:hypothetical protein [Cyclobacteriaceae bacterium]